MSLFFLTLLTYVLLTDWSIAEYLMHIQDGSTTIYKSHQERRRNWTAGTTFFDCHSKNKSVNCDIYEI